MYTMKILEREPALSHFLSAHLPPQWGRALSSAPAGRADLVVVSPDLIQVPSAPTACRALLAPGSLAHLAGELSAAWVVSYGLTPRDTLTFSSLGQDTLCLALQRELVTLSGDCLEVTQEDPLGAYAVDYIKYDVKQTPSYYQVEIKLAYAVDPEELSQVISVTGSTAVEQELRALLPDQPEKVVFRISYFTQEDSAETLRQAVQEAYQAQTRPLPPLLGVEVKLYPDSGQQRVAEILLTWQAREHQTVEDFLGNLKN